MRTSSVLVQEICPVSKVRVRCAKDVVELEAGPSFAIARLGYLSPCAPPRRGWCSAHMSLQSRSSLMDNNQSTRACSKALTDDDLIAASEVK